MQHIAVSRPEIAASSIDVAKVEIKPESQDGFSRHLQQQRDDYSAAEQAHRHQSEQRQRRKTQENNTERPSAHHVQDKKQAEGASEPRHENEAAGTKRSQKTSGDEHRPTDKRSEDYAREKTEPVAKADDTVKKPSEDRQVSEENAAKEPLVQHTETAADKGETAENEEQQAQQWLELVHKLVSQSQSDSAETTEGKAEHSSLTDTSSQTLSDQHKALLEKWGLDAEKVQQHAISEDKLNELQALLNQSQGQEQAADELGAQVLALLLANEKSMAGKPVDGDARLAAAQNQVLQSGKEGSSDSAASKARKLLDVLEHESKPAQLRPLAEQSAIKVTEELTASSSLPASNVAPMVDKPKTGNEPKDTLKTSMTLEQLARLPEPELDKTLQKLAEQLPVKDGDAVVVNRFIDNLKAGIEEFKQQRQQGREPGLDLQSLVSRAMSTETTVQPEQQQMMQAVKQLAESMPASASATRSEVNTPFAVSAAAERVAGADIQAATESAKTTANTVMERAVNIARPEAAGQLAERVRMLVNQGNMSADIRLDPPDLGSMQIRISMNGEQASVSFVVQSQQARDMLDQAVPRLRDMLAERGIELGQSSVEQQNKGGAEGDAQQQGKGRLANTEDELTEQAGAQQGQEIRLANGALGGIDYFV